MSYRTSMHGVEVFPGVGTPLSFTTRYGAAFVAVGSGALMAGWVNYSPIFFKPHTRCEILGGRWVLLSRLGLAAGCFAGGRVMWNRNLTLARIEGGLRGGGVFEGVLNHLPFPPRIGLLLHNG